MTLDDIIQWHEVDLILCKSFSSPHSLKRKKYFNIILFYKIKLYICYDISFKYNFCVHSVKLHWITSLDISFNLKNSRTPVLCMFWIYEHSVNKKTRQRKSLSGKCTMDYAAIVEVFLIRYVLSLIKYTTAYRYKLLFNQVNIDKHHRSFTIEINVTLAMCISFDQVHRID